MTDIASRNCKQKLQAKIASKNIINDLAPTLSKSGSVLTKLFSLSLFERKLILIGFPSYHLATAILIRVELLPGLLVVDKESLLEWFALAFQLPERRGGVEGDQIGGPF